MAEQERQPVMPAEYHRLFEGDPLGQKIFEDLYRRFVKPPVYEGGIDGVRKSDFRAGARSVVEFIVRRINQATGAEPITNDEEV